MAVASQESFLPLFLKESTQLITSTPLQWLNNNNKLSKYKAALLKADEKLEIVTFNNLSVNRNLSLMVAGIKRKFLLSR